MAFTKRHYEEVARIIRENQEHVCTDPDTRLGWHAATSNIRIKLNRMFAGDNPRFDGTRFDMACEPKGEK